MRRFESCRGRVRTALGTKWRATAAIAVALVGFAALSACGSSGQSTARPTDASSSSSPTSTPTTINPLTGLSGATGPVLILKIDNTANALPHIGLAAADVVYVEEVEGGLTRLAAVYSSKVPSRVAPIRSARETDAELFPMYGRVAIGYSGAEPPVRRLIKASRLIDVGGGSGYARLSSRSAPYNEYAVPRKLLARAKNSATATSVGFVFGELPSGGRPATKLTATFPSARIVMTYDPSSGKWRYSLGTRPDISPEGRIAADTVIVQSVRLSSTGRKDAARNAVPKVNTIGSGTAIVLRDGRSFTARWSRPTIGSPTRFLINGADVPLKPGKVWVILLDKRLTPKITGPKVAPTATATPR